MKQQYAAGSATLCRGFAWHVYPDQATPGVMAGDNPFSTGDLPNAAGSGMALPRGVHEVWSVRQDHPGLLNRSIARSFLVLTTSDDPPPVSPGWFAEPARLEENFQLDQRGDRWVRLVRIIQSRETPLGTVQECEFQVDRT